MFEMFELLISSHPHILISSVSCVLACTLTSSHPYILVFMCTCLYPTSLHTHILRFMCRRLHPCILLSSDSRVLACNLASHILISLDSCSPGAFWYPRILTSSGSSARKYLGNWNQIKTMVLTKIDGLYENK